MCQIPSLSHLVLVRKNNEVLHFTNGKTDSHLVICSQYLNPGICELYHLPTVSIITHIVEYLRERTHLTILVEDE